jgi:hypothetical protein
MVRLWTRQFNNGRLPVLRCVALVIQITIGAIIIARSHAQDTVLPPAGTHCSVTNTTGELPRIPLDVRDDVEPGQLQSCFPATDPIPVLGVSVVHDNHMFLPRLIYSIDYPVKHIVITYSGLDRTVSKVVLAIKRDFPNVTLLRYPRHQSCAEGWNSIINAFPDEPWYVLPNYDVFFPPGQLRKLAYAFPSGPAEQAFVYSLNMKLFGYGVFALKRSLILRAGAFDENLYPAYHEDHDWTFRLWRLVPSPVIASYINIYHVHGLVQDRQYMTGQNRMHEAGSKAHVRTHDRLMQMGAFNAAYMDRKWGASREFSHPFNNTNFSMSHWVIDKQARLDRLHIEFANSSMHENMMRLWNSTWTKID